MQNSFEQLRFDNLENIREFEKTALTQRLEEKNTYEILKKAAEKNPNKTALTFLPPNEPLNTEKTAIFTYAQLLEQVHRTANLLLELGIKKGDVVSYILPNIPENYFIYLAAQGIGAIANPINATFSESQIAELFKTAETKLLITGAKEFTPPDLWKNIEEAKKTAGVKQTIYVGPGENNFSDLLKDQATQFKPTNISLDDTAALFHSSNTTGEPKLVKLSHKGLIFMAYLCGIYGKYHQPNSVILSALPMFHVAAPMLGGLSVFKYGAETVVMGPFGWMDPSMIQNFWKIVEHYHGTSFTALPFIFNLLLQIPLEGAKADSLRSAISGMAVPEHEVKQFKELTGIDIDVLWGQTEVTALGIFNPGDKAQPGSPYFGAVGFPCPYQETRIVQIDAGENYLRDCAPGEEGVLLVKGPHVGEYKKPELNRTIIPGWHNTGDWVSQDNEGCIQFHCRVNDFIYRNNQFVPLLQIEKAIAEHKDVQRVAVIGIEDPQMKNSKVPVAYIELKPTAKITMKELHEWTTEILAKKKHLIPVELINPGHALPVNGMGKVLKYKLEEEHQQTHQNQYSYSM